MFNLKTKSILNRGGTILQIIIFQPTVSDKDILVCF